MKIIEKGTKILPEEKVYITKCKTCGCKFTYKMSDIEYIGIDCEGLIMCPQCNRRVYVPLIKRKYKGIIDKNS